MAFTPNSQTQDYLEDLSGTLDMIFTKVQDLFMRIDPILQPEIPCAQIDKAPPRNPETKLNAELQKLLEKATASKGYLDCNFPRISI